MGHAVDLTNVGINFNGSWAVRNIDVRIDPGEFFSFLGPSGCGKTTLLRLISGFLDPAEGEIRIDSRNMRGIGPNKRHTALIFQNLALFPLMTVAENIGFGLEVRGVGRQERLKRVEELLELVDLPEAGGSRIADLSGGQKQRVAIARALAVEPSVLMLDEPLSALDLKLRQHMRTELRKIQKRTGVTFIYITHDQTEALTMSDRIGVMSKGRIEQLGAPDQIYNQPLTPFVASFVGETNRISGRVCRTNGQTAELDTSIGRLHCRNPLRLGEGEQSIAFIRPESITLAIGEDGQHDNSLECQVEDLGFEGAFINLVVKTRQGERLTVRLNNSGRALELSPKSMVNVAFRADQALILAAGNQGNG
jgi:spermidine/putrescine transport system ATP-binding protein